MVSKPVKRTRPDQNVVALDRYRKAPLLPFRRSQVDQHWASIIEALLLKVDLPADELSDRGE